MALDAAVQLLTTALLLLQLVNANPNLPQSMRDTANSVAQNAIVEAKRALGNQSPTIPTPSVQRSASIDQTTSSSGSFTLSGSARGVTRLTALVISSSYTGSTEWTVVSQLLKGGGSYSATSNDTSVYNGRWSAPFSGFTNGSYKVLLYDTSCTGSTPSSCIVSLLTSGPLTIGSDSSWLLAPHYIYVNDALYSQSSSLSETGARAECMRAAEDNATVGKSMRCIWNGKQTYNRSASAGAPSCTLTSNKSSYVSGESITFSWTSLNATYAAWVPDTSGKDTIWLPGDKLAGSGSYTVSQYPIGNPYVTLAVYNADGARATCTKTVPVYLNLSTGKASATASRVWEGNAANNVVDGSLSTIWNAGARAMQSIIVDLGGMYTPHQIMLTTEQAPAGETTHSVYMSATGEGSWKHIKTFQGYTTNAQTLTYTLPEPMPNVRYVLVETTASPSWVAWKEIEVWGY